MSRSILERRLMDVATRRKRLRADLAVLEEQYRFLEDEAQDAELRALVSETPLADAEARESRKHADALVRQREALLRSLGELDREQDALLDRMSEGGSASPPPSVGA